MKLLKNNFLFLYKAKLPIKLMRLNIVMCKSFNSLSFKKSISLNQFSKRNFCVLGQDNKQKFSEQEALEIVEAGIFEILKNSAKIKLDKLSRAASFQDLGFDSLDQVELIVAFEEHFNINLNDDDTLKIQTVLDAIQICHKEFLKIHSEANQLEKKTEGKIN